MRKNSLLQTVRCTELAHKKTATSFPSIRRGRQIFNWWACVKTIVDEILNPWSDRIFLPFAFISNWVTNFKVGFRCVMFMSTVVLLDVFSAWITITYHARINIKSEMCFCLKFFATILPNIFKIGQQHTSRVIANKKRVSVFWNTVYYYWCSLLTMSFKSGFERIESRSLTQQVAVSSKSGARQCRSIVWRMMSVEMAHAAVGRTTIECCVKSAKNIFIKTQVGQKERDKTGRYGLQSRNPYINKWIKPKFHLVRHVISRQDTTPCVSCVWRHACSKMADDEEAAVLAYQV